MEQADSGKDGLGRTSPGVPNGQENLLPILAYDGDELISSRESLNEFLNNVPSGIGIYYVYLDGRIVNEYLNDGYYSLLDTTREERRRFSGATVFDAVSSEDEGMLRDEVYRAIAEN